MPRPAPTTSPTAGRRCRGREVAQAVFERSGRWADDVTPISTEAYAAGVLAQGKPFAPRPLRLRDVAGQDRATGFEPEDALAALERYLVASERP